MDHRHLTTSRDVNGSLSATAIDDIICRGSLEDWRELREAFNVDSNTLSRTLRVTEANLSHPYSMHRYILWDLYARHIQEAAKTSS